MTSRPYILLEVIHSTQDVAREHARAGCVSGTIVAARAQLAGRGRGGRSWESRDGLGLWMTYVHRTKRASREWGGATLATAMAVCAVLQRLDLDPSTRWPNDVLLPGGKVAGILADTEGNALLIGVGVNVLHQVDDFSGSLREVATSVRLAGGMATPDSLLGALADELDSTMADYELGGVAPFLGPFWRRCIFAGREVIATLPDGNVVEGIASGLGGHGELTIEADAGARAIMSGTVRLKETA